MLLEDSIMGWVEQCNNIRQLRQSLKRNCWHAVTMIQFSQSRINALEAIGPVTTEQFFSSSQVRAPMASRRYISESVHSSTINCCILIDPGRFRICSLWRSLTIKSCGLRVKSLPKFLLIGFLIFVSAAGSDDWPQPIMFYLLIEMLIKKELPRRLCCLNYSDWVRIK